MEESLRPKREVTKWKCRWWLARLGSSRPYSWLILEENGRFDDDDDSWPCIYCEAWIMLALNHLVDLVFNHSQQSGHGSHRSRFTQVAGHGSHSSNANTMLPMMLTSHCMGELYNAPTDSPAVEGRGRGLGAENEIWARERESRGGRERERKG